MRALFACVSENGEAWYREVFTLVLSVRRFGGALADAPFLVHVVEHVDPWFARGLESLGAEVRVVPRMPGIPMTNKLRMFDEPEADPDHDVLVALDCDTVVVGHISRHLLPRDVRAKPANHDVLTEKQWAFVFDALGVPTPSRSMVMTASGKLTYPYLNSAVVIVPRAMRQRLHDEWLGRIEQLEALRAPNRRTLPWQHIDQISFSLTLGVDGLPYDPLPVSLNLSTRAPVHPLYRPQVVPPFILHHHKAMAPDGSLYRPSNPALRSVVDEVNRARSDALQIPDRGTPAPPLMEDVRLRLRRARRAGAGDLGIRLAARLLPPWRRR